MFIGHFAIGFIGKKLAPQLSLGTLFLGVQFADLLWPTLLLLNVEKVNIAPGITAVTPFDFIHYPFSHSLFMLILWGFLCALIVWIYQRSFAAAMVMAGCVLSHWFLDVITHREDMPLTLTSTKKLGFGLWNSLQATIMSEGALFAVAIILFIRHFSAASRKAVIALWGLIGFLIIVWLANFFGPPPANTSTLAWACQSLWLLVLYGYWLDRLWIKI